jgi:phosphopentomutase
MAKRITVIVLDGVGIGEAPDADKYGDVGSNSIANVAKVLGGINLPNMEKFGLGNIFPIDGVNPTKTPKGGWGKLTPKSDGKDTVTGHWELMGIRLVSPFPTYPNGFPDEVLNEFKLQTGRGVLANIAASGTDIIVKHGVEHMESGDVIVYTSADSVFQIAAHEGIIPIEEQYKICKIARNILVGKHGVGRVIARPFVGENPENFTRTKNRKDFARIPETPTMMDKLVSAGLDVYSVGKIDDIFGHRGITKSNHTLNNLESIDAMKGFLKEEFSGLLFVNLIEFDMNFGHRNDPKGYAGALVEFDNALPDIQALLSENDIVMICADHGVDPTTESTDHSREYVPILVFGPEVNPGEIGTRGSFSDVAATIAAHFSLEKPLHGESFLQSIIKR